MSDRRAGKGPTATDVQAHDDAHSATIVIEWRGSPAFVRGVLDARLDGLMQRLVDLGVTDPSITLTYSDVTYLGVEVEHG